MIDGAGDPAYDAEVSVPEPATLLPPTPSPTASDADSSGADRRLSTRVLVDFEVDCEIEDNYLFASITDISATGIFIRTNTPETMGTRLNLRFATPPRTIVGLTPANDHDDDQLDDGIGVGTGQRGQFALEAVVAWVNPLRPGQADNLHPGMGVRFVDLDDRDRRRLARLIRRMAYLPDAG